MNLLTATWVPIQDKGLYEKITVQQLLCGEKERDICLPRDDMELACLQLLSAITQTLFTPENKKSLGKYVTQPLTPEVYLAAIQDKLNWFDLDHPDTPFMQFRGVKSTSATPMNKLMAGVADGTNKTFVNPQGLIEGLCHGCVAIALFNAANNCPSMGGGFKGSLRGSTPITLLIKGKTVRETIWLNVLTEETINQMMPWYEATKDQVPNYLTPINKGGTIQSSAIGLLRGLLWQPAHFELLPATSEQQICSCCGCNEQVYTGFNKEKFSYTIEGVWPHPLSSRIFTIKAGNKKEKFPSFTTRAPTWTHMSRLVVDQQTEKGGQQAAPVIQQARQFIASEKMQLIVGGYRNNQATILERRHDLFSLEQGWAEHGEVIHRLIETGLSYKQCLINSLIAFKNGRKKSKQYEEIKGAGINLVQNAEENYYQQTENLMQQGLAQVHFEAPEDDLDALQQQLKSIVKDLFNQATAPYRQEPKMLKALAMARRSLHKYLKNLEPQGEKNE